jgi:hypothetical protein
MKGLALRKTHGLTSRNCDFTMENGDFTINKWDFTMERFDLTKHNWHKIIKSRANSDLDNKQV